MPKKTRADIKRKSNPKRARTEFKDYVNVYLRPDEKKDLIVWWKDNSPRLIDMLCELAEDGYSVTTRSDTYDSGTYQANIMAYWADDAPDANHGYILSSRSGDSTIAALAECLYYHYVVCDGGDWLD